MSPHHKWREIWHDAYYRWTGKAGVEFALRCRDVTASVDLKTKDQSLMQNFRQRLHLSLCQQCHDYGRLTQVLHRGWCAHLSRQTEPDLKKLNRRLLRAFAKRD